MIYGDENQLARLDDEEKYLWVGYNPIPDPQRANFPLDHTHEREWRARVMQYHYLDWGLTPIEGVPLVLPPELHEPQVWLPWILVRTSDQASELRGWLSDLPEYEGGNGFIQQFYAYRAHLVIVALDTVRDYLSAGERPAGERRWAKFETLPGE